MYIPNRRVKIVATVGPASRAPEMLEKLYLAGVDVFRLNFSHADYSEHKVNYENIRNLEKNHNKPLAILADLQGPKLRVGKFKNAKEVLEAGQKFRLDLNQDLGDVNRINLPHPQIFQAIKKGSSLLVDDGKIRLEVEEFGNDYAVTKVIFGGTISNAKGVNFPSGVLDISSLTEKDLQDLDFALSLGVDFIGLSFVQLPGDVEYAKNLIKGRAKIISKIEKPSAVEHIDGIIELSDGIMVARGDLGVEIPINIVPTVQKKIIKKCRTQAKPVIVATQMLDSMINSPIPTRAEASDVANAVYDGADSVMLSGETTVGLYPVETVSMMAAIIHSVESDSNYWHNLKVNYVKNTEMGVSDCVSSSVSHIAEEVGAKIIVAFSAKGATINRVSRDRTSAKLLAITNDIKLYNSSVLGWGVNPLYIDSIQSFSEVVDLAGEWLVKEKWVKAGDRVVIVAGIPFGVGGVTNSIRVIEID